MIYLLLITGLALTGSFLADRTKTYKAIKMSGKKILKILPAFFMMLIFVSLVLFFVPEEVMLKYLDSENHWLSLLLASFLGSITLMPGFIAFPLSGLLLEMGVGYMVIAMFTTTLMMVGLITFPVEKVYFGIRLTIIRNIASFIIAILVSVVIGLLYGELL